MKTNQKGFSVVAILIILLVVIVGIGFAGWSVWKKGNDLPSKQATVQNSAPENKSNTQEVKLNEYKDVVAGFTLKYPETWIIKTESGDQGGAEYPTTATEIKSPSGVVLKVRVHYGGKGGGCEPGPNDKPHQAGNLCNTKEYLSIEQLEQTVEAFNKRSPLISIDAKFTSTSGETQYVIGLQADQQEGYKTEANKPYMGFLTPQYDVSTRISGNKHGYITAYAVDKNKDFLASEDGIEIKKILRSISFAR